MTNRPHKDAYIKEGTPEVAFPNRLDQLHSSREVPAEEIEAAVNVFERLVTAKAICESAFMGQYTHASVLEVFSALTAAVQVGQANRTRE